MPITGDSQASQFLPHAAQSVDIVCSIRYLTDRGSQRMKSD